MSVHAYSEDQLVEQPAIGLFATPGWQTVSALEETLGAGGTRDVLYAAAPLSPTFVVNILHENAIRCTLHNDVWLCATPGSNWE